MRRIAFREEVIADHGRIQKYNARLQEEFQARFDLLPE